MAKFEVKSSVITHSQTSFSSLSSLTISSTGSLLSELSVQSSEESIQSQTSIQSQVSVQSQTIISSQSSLQSELSLLSQSSIGFLPSLTRTSLLSDHNQQQGKLDYHCVGTIKGGEDGHVSSLVSAGDYLYGGLSSKNIIKVWFKDNLMLEGCAHKFGYKGGAVKALVVVRDKVLSGHQDNKIRVWKRYPSKQQHAHYTQDNNHRLIATMPIVKDYLRTFLPAKNYVQVRRHHKRLWIEHVDAISALAVSKNQEFLYSASWDRSIKVWRLSDFKCLESFKAHDDAINALAVSDDGYVYTGSADSKIKVWIKPNKEKKHSMVTTLEGHKSAVNAVALSPDGGMLYSGACNRAIIVWGREESAQHMVMAGTLRGHRHAILCLSTIADVLCSGSADKTIRIWRREEAQGRKVHSCVAVLQGHKGPVKCLSVSTEANLGFFVYSGSLDHEIKMWWFSNKPKIGKKALLSEETSKIMSPIVEATQLAFNHN